MQFSKQLILVSGILLTFAASAENFEIIDGTAKVTGAPNHLKADARTNWVAACEDWKRETVQLNKNDQVIMMACQDPACPLGDDGYFTCSSQASFKIKTSGTQVSATPVQPATYVTEEVVTTPPPQVIVETVPAPRPGFLWISGYWGWHENRHHWYGGHWEHSHPGHVWIQPRWAAHGHGWHLEGGHWR
ncbi:MAG: YXWGXW repeat-containing protein [Bdellovibrionales bacterium]